MLHDLKHACRLLLQSKRWTIVVLTLPVPDPASLVRLAA